MTRPRQCLDCYTITTNGSRCEACEAAIVANADPATRRSRAQGKDKIYNYAWRKLSIEARRRQPWCSVCGATDDLTADHIVPIAEGGRNVLSNIRVLCRRHNSEKGKRYA